MIVKKMASPEDLMAQREKIQREILALETTLGSDGSIAELLSSGSSSEEQTDESEKEEDEVAPEDLNARREKIQREIAELEQTLHSDAALVDVLRDSEHGTGSQTDFGSEDSDDEDLDIPQDVETCLQMNLVYQEVLKEKLVDLERLLNENRQQQKEIEAQLSGPASKGPGLPHLKLFLGNFMKPYFKDKLSGLGPPANEETKEIMSHGTRPCDEMKIRRWEGWQKTLLTSSVVTDTMKRMLQPKLSKMEYLTTKMLKAGEEEKENIRKQIAILEKSIAEISSMTEEMLYGDIYDDHDWDKISNIDFEGLRQPDDLKRFWQNYLHPSINKSTWNQDEIEKLAIIAKKYHGCHWDQIAKELATNRTAFMCFQTYQRYISKTFRKREWSPKEDQILRDLVEKMRIGNFIPYTQMSYFMEGRDHTQLMYRWTTVLDPSIKKGPWSKEEDQLLLKAVEKYGKKDWWKIRLEVPGRTDNSCRDRYMDCLRENVKRGPWSDEEVELLKSLVKKYGVGKWSKVASEMPNRIDCQCLNKWKWLMKTGGIKRERRETPLQMPNPKRGRWSKNQLKKTKEQLEDDSTSEEETIKLEYMDSDDEKVQPDKSPEEDVECREPYIQPDMKKWIPVCGNLPGHPSGTVRTDLVQLPTPEEEQAHQESATEQSGTALVGQPILRRITVLDQLGNLVKSYAGKEPPPLQKWDLCNKNAMIKVPVNDVRQLVKWKGLTWKGKRDNTKTSPGQSNEKHKHTKAAAKNELSTALQLAVIPWIGSVLMPLPPSKSTPCEADIVRKRGSAIPLPKTPMFLLFLKALHIDVEGCKKIIATRQSGKAPKPKPVVKGPKVKTVKTVAALLKQRKEQNSSNPSQHQGSEQPLTLLFPKLQQQVEAPQSKQTASSVMTSILVASNSNTQQGKGFPQSVGQGTVTLLKTGTQVASNVPQTASWILTPTGLVPVAGIRIPSPVVIGQTQNQVLPNSVPQVFLQPSIILKQNASLAPVQTVRLGNPTNVTTAPVLPGTYITIPAAGTNLNQNVPPSSISNTPGNSHSVPLVSSNTTDVPTSVPGSPVISAPSTPQRHPGALGICRPVVQNPSALLISNQNQRNPIQVPQVVFRQPVLVNQNNTLTIINTAGPRLPINSPKALNANVPVVLQSPAASNDTTIKDSVTKTPSLSLLSPVNSVPVTSSSYSVINSVSPGPSSALKVTASFAKSASSNITSSDITLCSINSESPSSLRGNTETQSEASQKASRARKQTFDPKLMFFEPPSQVNNWIEGNGGISLPHLEKKMPYLPPFVSNINTLATLLKAKESFVKAAEKLLPEEDCNSSEEEAKVAAIRKLVSEKYKTNQAYLHLKARFLSCFTLPALLATINPCKEPDLTEHSSDDDDSDEDEVRLQTEEVLLSTSESEASAAQFSGIRTRSQSNSNTGPGRESST